MADGGQRLLDVIDDPNALESFLGGLTSASDLLPSGESVDTVVASLAESLEADYDVGSPNETLFDTLESSNTLTDISRSYVESEFENEFHGLGNGPVGGNGDEINMDALVQSTLEQHNFGTGVCDAITLGTASGPIQQTASTYVHQTAATVTSTIAHQEQLVGGQHQEQQQQQQQQLVHNQTKVEQDVNSASASSRTYAESFSQLVGVHEDHEKPGGLSHNNNASLSTINNVSSSVCSISSTSLISSSQGSSSSDTSNITNVNGPLGSAGAEEASVGLVGDVGSLVGGANSSNLISANVVNVPNNNVSVSGNVVASAAAASLSQEVVRTVAGNQVNTSLSLVQQQVKSIVSAGSAGIQLQQTGHEQQQQQVQQRYILSNPLLQQTQVNVGGQLISSIAGGQPGTNLVHFSTASGSGGGQQQYITLDGSQAPTFIAANGSTFGALVNAGGTPTYTVLPASSGIFSNTIQVQSGIQALKTASGQTFFQTPSGSIVAANNLTSIPNVQGVTIPTSPTVNRGKQQPQQILPKPVGEAPQPSPSPSPGQIVLQPHQQIHTSTAFQASTAPGGQFVQTSQLQTSIAGQLVQQAQHSVVSHMVQPTNTTVIPANSNLNFSTQPTFTIGGANGVGQVVLSTGATLGTAQPQIGGTFVLNQFGQPMLLPSAGGTGTNGVQLMFRQQPSHAQQMFTIQTTSGGAGQKPVVRLVPQISQNTVQIQQIQTPNGPAYIAVRCPTPQTQATHQQFIHAPQQQPQGDVKPQIQVQAQQIKIETGVRQAGIAQMQGNTVVRPVLSNGILQQQAPTLNAATRPQITIKAEKVLLDQVSNQTFGNPASVTSMPSPASSGPPTPIETSPKKKASKSKKKKVMLDLDEILNMSGIGDEDLQDDSCFENAVPDASSFFMNEGSSSSFNQSSGPSTPLQQGVGGSPSPKANGAVKSSGGGSLYSPHVHVLQPTTQASKSKKSKGGGGAGSSSGSSKSTTPSVPPAPTIPKPSPKKKSPAKRKADVDKEIEPQSKKKGSPANNKKSNNGFTNNNNSIKANNNNIASTPVHTPAPKRKRPPAKSPVIKTETVSPLRTPGPTTGSLPSTSSVSTPQASPTTVPQSSPQRIVQTIQLTPQNQQLLRNIQVQIQRLLGIPKRNETEQTALQKLVYLQQQVIATGVPVSNPPHLITGSGSGTEPNAPVPAKGVVGAAGQQAATISNTTTIKLTTSSLNAAQGPHVNVVPKTYLSPVLPAKSASSLLNVALSNNQKTEVAYTSPADALLSKGGSPLGPTVVVIEDSKTVEQRRAQAKAEEEARARWKKEQFEFLLKRDQEFYVKPDCETPFTSVEDAVERLMKYHIVKDRTDMNFEDFDDEFSDTAVRLLDKFNNMVHKYKGLMLKESMKEVSLAERVMVERKFCNEEKLRLEQDKLLVAQGEILDLPPPPDEWVPQLREMVEEDLREFELDTSVSVQVQSAIDSITSFDDDESYPFDVDGPKNEYDEYGNLLSSSGTGYPNDAPSSSADIDEAVRSILF